MPHKNLAGFCKLVFDDKISTIPSLTKSGILYPCDCETEGLTAFPSLWNQVQASLIIMLSLGSIETNGDISEPCYNEVSFYRHICKIINLGAMTWSCYNENCIIMRRIITRLKILIFSILIYHCTSMIQILM